MKKLVPILIGVVVVVAVVAMALPSIVGALGLHPRYEGERVSLPGKKALIVATNHAVLNAPGETEGDPTGVAMSELTVPYYAFSDAGMTVDVASINGGEIAIDPQTLSYVSRTPEDDRYLEDAALQAKVDASMPIDSVDVTEYDAIFFAGGWGAAYDFGYSDALAQKVSEAYFAETPVIGSVCHGALALINAKDQDGSLLIEGRKMTGVTDKQVRELGIEITPMHPETELRKAGAIFESQTAFRDVFATHVVVDDEERFVTGQNQNSGAETAHKMMALIDRRS